MSFRFAFIACLILAAILCGANAAPADALEDAEKAILELHTSGKLYDKKEHKAVRAAFARWFEAKHDADIQQAFGDDKEKLGAWLESHADLKQGLYTAIDDRFDKVPEALMLFKELWKKWPADVDKYHDLAIAAAVTWDMPRGVVDYAHHQVRTKSKLPGGLLEGPENFRYLVDNEKITEGRVRFMPWEFLVFVVDHKTPVEERKWAQQYYLTHRTAKSWHQDVPYDNDMLKGEKDKNSRAEPHLKDMDYSLPNIKRYGGVCANQADFASRVAKSVGIPAVYCRGESAYRGGHAWWMFVTIQKASADQLLFTLNSDGRFQGFIKDAFYTGTVIDPQSGETLLDRDMERRLNLAGRDRQGKRQVDLLMRAYPWLAEKESWDVKQRVTFLDKCLKLSPQHDGPWLEFAKLVKVKELADDQKKIVRSHVSTVLNDFKAYPDFVARIFADLLGVFEPAEQVKQYQQAVALFERAGRPDLACDVRLKITDALVEQKLYPAAMDGLVATITKFPTEGRYIPKMTLKLQDVSPQVKGGNDRLARLYIELVPKLIAYYKDDDPTLGKFHKDLYKQALEFLEKNQMAKYVSELKLRSGQL
jgi:hypothetical protein